MSPDRESSEQDAGENRDAILERFHSAYYDLYKEMIDTKKKSAKRSPSPPMKVKHVDRRNASV